MSEMCFQMESFSNPFGCFAQLNIEQSLLGVERIVEFFFSYLIHSSLILLSCWAFTKFTQRPHPKLTQFVWRTAMVSGLVTATLTTFCIPQTSRNGNSKNGNTKSGGTNQNDSKFTTDQLALSSQTDDIQLRIAHESTISGVQDSTDHVIHAERKRAGIFNRPSHLNDKTTGDRLSNSPIASQFSQTGATKDDHQIEDSRSSNWWIDSVEQSIGKGIGLRWTKLENNQMCMIAIASLFIASVSFGIIRSVVCLFRLNRTFQKFRRLESHEPQALFDSLLRQRKLTGKFELLESDSLQQPIAIGFFRKCIVLPSNIEARVNREELMSLFAHELAHLVRRDNWWLWIGNVICWSLWFQPMNFGANRRALVAGEEVCDRWAIDGGIQPLVLAKCLTAIAATQPKTQIANSAMAAAGSASCVVRRVERLLDENKVSFKRLHLILVVSLLVCFLVIPIYGPRFQIGASEIRYSEELEFDQGDSSETETQTVVEKAAANSIDPASLTLLQNAWQELKHDLAEVDRLMQLVQRKGENRSTEVNQLMANLQQRHFELMKQRDLIQSEVKLLIQHKAK